MTNFSSDLQLKFIANPSQPQKYLALSGIACKNRFQRQFNNILSDCHISDEIYYLLNAFRLDLDHRIFYSLRRVRDVTV